MSRTVAWMSYPICTLRGENVLTFFPPDWGVLRRSRCVKIFFLNSWHVFFRDHDDVIPIMAYMGESSAAFAALLFVVCLNDSRSGPSRKT